MSPDSPQLRSDVPHTARVYDYMLGGKDNFAADRAAGDQIVQSAPEILKAARDNRRFLARTVTSLVRERGIRQFLDIGTGIPTSPNLHEVAQAIAPESRVVYVDNDPLVLVHARALLTSAPEGATAYLATPGAAPSTCPACSATSTTLFPASGCWRSRSAPPRPASRSPTTSPPA
jgi:hypothetical protein